jgi:RNA-directed DNA polymerase
VLNAVYEEDFLGFSYGFRPGRSPRDALDALAAGIYRSTVNWVLDADIRGFSGQLDRAWREEFLRIADERVLRLVGKWLAAGVIEDGTWTARPRLAAGVIGIPAARQRVPALCPGPVGRLVAQAPGAR